MNYNGYDYPKYYDEGGFPYDGLIFHDPSGGGDGYSKRKVSEEQILDTDEQISSIIEKLLTPSSPAVQVTEERIDLKDYMSRFLLLI